MIQFSLIDVQAKVSRMIDGSAVLSVIDPKSGITVVIPFDGASAREVGNALASPLHVANGTEMPPHPPEAA